MLDTVYNFIISDNAANRIKEIRSKRNNDNLFLRVSISGGGCAGFSYNFSYDEIVHNGDLVFAKDQAKVVIDETSIEFLNNAEIEYISVLSGSNFEISNPNAISKCGCGTSFSVKIHDTNP